MKNEVKCSGEGCTAVFRTEEQLHCNVKYLCRLHTEKAPLPEPDFVRAKRNAVFIQENKETGEYVKRFDVRRTTVPKTV